MDSGRLVRVYLLSEEEWVVGSLISSICQFPGSNYFQHDQFPATTVISPKPGAEKKCQEPV